MVSKSKSASRKNSTSKKSAAKSVKKSPGSRAASEGGAQGTHTIKEDFKWVENVGNHPERKDSPEYAKARKIMVKLVQTAQPWYLGEAPYQDHHGGSLWVKDEEGWFLLKNLAGMEWSSQFCADPEKVDVLRRNAKRLYAKFPLTAEAFKEMGFDLNELLDTPITDIEGIARWTDSICNASLPLPAGRHTGVLPKDTGVHHYPTPVTDIQLFKYDDFQLFVTDEEGQHTAVVPVAPRGSGDHRVSVEYATPGTKLHEQQQAAHKNDKQLILSGDHSVSQKAFVNQKAKPAGKKASSKKKAAAKKKAPTRKKAPAKKKASK